MEPLPPTTPAQQTILPSDTPLVVGLDQVPPRDVEWLWPGWIPLGKLTLMDGDPDLGKSTLLLDLAARLSRGDAMPDCSGGLRAHVTLLTGEDSLHDTVRPRLEAARAEVTRIHALKAIRAGDGSRPPVIPGDLPAIEQALRQTDSRLMLVDPFMAFLDRSVDAASDQAVRRCLYRVAELAERTRCAVVLLRHLNKSSGTRALYRGGGSIGIIGAARSGLLVARDPTQPSDRVLAVTKTNLAQAPASLRFRLQVVGHKVCRVDWCGNCPLGADELLGIQDSPRDRSAIAEASAFLQEFLKAGPQAAHECLAAAKRQQISQRTLKRAKEQLGVVSTALRFPDGSIFGFTWQLP
jgi:hypothetical protein